MAEYTPTTAQVRDYYISGCRIRRETIQQHYLGHPEPDYRAEFDRWLAAHDAEVARQAALRECDLDTAHWLRARAARNDSEGAS